MSYDIRYNNYHIINHNLTNKWSTDLHQFPGIPQAFEFERAFIPYGDDLQELTLTKWHYSFYISVVYLITIFSIQKLMENKKAFSLRGCLAAWNILLALFSIFGTIRVGPEFIHMLFNQGVKASYCKASYYNDFRLTLWYFFFTLSKAAELIDTIFIVLRKQKLLTLHWVHHVLTLNYSWYVFADVPATARWMVTMNFFIHSLMYSYYALRAMRVSIPRSVNMTITTLQIAQMFAGLYINYRALQLKLLGMPCDISIPVAVTGFTLYGLFAVLFINFFLWTYLFSSKKSIKFISDMNHNQEYNNFLKKLQ